MSACECDRDRLLPPLDLIAARLTEIAREQATLRELFRVVARAEREWAAAPRPVAIQKGEVR